MNIHHSVPSDIQNSSVEPDPSLKVALRDIECLFARRTWRGSMFVDRRLPFSCINTYLQGKNQVFSPREQKNVEHSDDEHCGTQMICVIWTHTSLIFGMLRHLWYRWHLTVSRVAKQANTGPDARRIGSDLLSSTKPVFASAKGTLSQNKHPGPTACSQDVGMTSRNIRSAFHAIGVCRNSA